jgi:hypothetical protein
VPSPDHHFHETWLGMVQPDGLVVSVPVLVDAQCARRLPLEVHRHFLELCPPLDPRHRGPGDPPRAIADLAAFLADLLDLTPDLYDIGDALPDELSLWVPEGRQLLRPTLALKNDPQLTPASGYPAPPAPEAAGPRAGRRSAMLESETNDWTAARPGREDARVLAGPRAGRRSAMLESETNDWTAARPGREDARVLAGPRAGRRRAMSTSTPPDHHAPSTESPTDTSRFDGRDGARPLQTPGQGDPLTTTKGDLPNLYHLLLWDLPDGLPLDKPETRTGPWEHPPAAKFERLLRHCRVPIGLLTNRRELRLVYAPHGESSGSITFRVDDMATVDGRPILDALVMLLSAHRLYGADLSHQLPALLRQSRERQADVTNELARQVLEALEILLRGFEAAAERDGSRLLEDALARDDDHLYGGLLTVLLRLVFVLYSEDRDLLPVENPLYQRHLSLLALFDELQRDVGEHPDSMARRFGAWGRLIALFRAIHYGASWSAPHAGVDVSAERPESLRGTAANAPSPGFDLPARGGSLFDPNVYPFLEGWGPGGSAPVHLAEERARVRVPSIADETVYRVLEKLLVLEGQRLSYRSLDVEQIGSVYEALMGYHVERVASTAACLGPDRVWVERAELEEVAASLRAKWIKERTGLTNAKSRELADAFTAAEKSADPKTAPTAARDEALDNVLDAVLAEARLRGTATARPGGLVLQPGEERRRTSSHYTPRSLSQPIVRKTLEPLLRCIGDEPSSELLLELKVCDPAMGSGAFLVEACRALGDELLAAWTREGALERIAPTDPKQAAHRGSGDPLLRARRLVAQRCLYGVDKNPFAVELAKLSLWLVTLARDLPFTFVDHALRCGDSLVGLDFDQIRAFHWSRDAPGGKKGKKGRQSDGGSLQLDLVEGELRRALEEAIALRRGIGEVDDELPGARKEMERLAEDARDALERVRLIADVCLGAFFAESKPKDRERERQRRLELVRLWLVGAAQGVEVSLAHLLGEGSVSATASKAEKAAPSEDDELEGDDDPAIDDAPNERFRRRVEAELRDLQAELHASVRPFHWMLELPEIFYAERPDPLEESHVNRAAFMDGFMGNPPFAGKNQIASAGGPLYVDWLQTVHPGSHGNADLVAHFFRRADALLGKHGAIGLIATNTIAQGDTRATGLQALARNGHVIYDAVQSMPWPGDASVAVAVVHTAKGRPAQLAPSPHLDGADAPAINSRLRPKPERADPRPLRSNAGCSFVGSYVLGMGFVLSQEERADLVARDRRNAERVFPYLGGEELNTHPLQEHSRYVISFGQMSLEEAERWPDLLAIVRETVKPERDRLANNPDGRRRKQYWWQFGRWTPALFEAIAPLAHCLANSRHSKHLVFALQPTDRIFSEATYVYPLAAYTPFAVLQSRIHEPWARLLSSSLEDRLRYAASDCFETFPFPSPEPRTVIPALEAAGQSLYEARAAFMRDTWQGLTQTYNALKDPENHDPAIEHLRTLHEDLDRAVLAAYGWHDLVPRLPPFRDPTNDSEAKAQEAFQDDIVDRLFLLNEERAEDESRLSPKRPPR